MAVFEGNFTHTEHLKFAIVSGRFNDLIMSKLMQGCKDALQRHGINVSEIDGQVDYVLVPGSFETPMIARQLAATGNYDAVICLGAVIRGQTPHFDYVAGEAAKGIAAAAFQTGVPIIFGIITADTMQQALERAGIKSNKGWEFGMNALEMASLMQQLRQSDNGIGFALPGDRMTAIAPAKTADPG
ncbi:6,7-dimethyl-8-ribityllumazine synthase [Thalassoporum mexicanum PCC 7367]|uniref:6,7-dimethyl-8-ribityllumazine synthase n=1 Tax=Thalassoporum mexicanum TaxID=3457544 RepID=UPI00029FA6AF|nr:6,7-dimethyl-8-ribityllumazine synthase [Pseudanabaena sp. PCC 7367]AFY69178.1 6,7-dimethyl-8-ribityllumazine synthase [Pseudanabaena sp. PCC 7367]